MGRKWNQDMTPSEKLLSVYSMLLFSGREISLTELSRRLECSKQTVRRLIDQLEAASFGTLLREMRGREVAYRLERPRNLPKISLDPEGLRQLALCRAFMLHLLPENMRDMVDVTLQHAAAYLPEGASSCAMEEMGQAQTKGVIDYSPFQEIRRRNEDQMIVIMKPGAAEESVKAVISYIESNGLTAHLSQGREVSWLPVT